MNSSVDLYWSFRSPYCYLAMDRLLKLQKDHGVSLNLRHVWPGAMRRSGYFSRLHANYRAYHGRDTQRLAQFLGLPYARPVPDPLVFDSKTDEPIADQPHIRTLTRMTLASRQLGQEIPFVSALMRLIWDGTVQGWDQGPHLRDLAHKAGLDFVALQQIAQANGTEFDKEVSDNGALLEAAGHWGVPCMVLDGEPFFGQDRIDMLIWRLGQKELKA